MTEALFGLLRKVNESPDYYDVLNYSLRVQMRSLGTQAEVHETDELRIPLGEAMLRSYQEGRVYRLRWEDSGGAVYNVRAEADHRGPEHGVDAWVSEGNDSSPDWVIEGTEVESGVDDD